MSVKCPECCGAGLMYSLGEKHLEAILMSTPTIYECAHCKGTGEMPSLWRRIWRWVTMATWRGPVRYPRGNCPRGVRACGVST